MPSVSPPELRLITGVGRGASPRAVESFRLRPGERPVWVELAVEEGGARAWRRRAGDVGLSVDVWIALQAEWSPVAGDLADQGVLEPVLARAQVASEAPALAPTDELRRWLRFLARGPVDDAENDLPSVAVPARLVARLGPASLAAELHAHAEHGLDEEALVLERAAAQSGMTMEAWAYREAARLRHSEPSA